MRRRRGTTLNSGSLVRRMNRACAQRGLFQYIQPEHPPAAPDAFSSLTRKLEVHHQADLPDVFLSVPEAAALAGCTTSCIYNWISKGLIESHKHFARRGCLAKRRTKRWISYRSLSRFLWGRECRPKPAPETMDIVSMPG